MNPDFKGPVMEQKEKLRHRIKILRSVYMHESRF